MSNIFAPWVRPWGTLPISIDEGPIVGGVGSQHLRFTDDGKIHCSQAVIHHYGAGLPFDVNGRLVVGLGDVTYHDQDIPFTSSGAVAVSAAPVVYYDQGLTFLASGHIAAGDTEPPPQEPIWSAIPSTQNFQYELPQTYDVSPYVSDGGDPIIGYSLVTPPTGFTIDNSGVITADGAAVAAHVLTVRATNSIGSSDTTMTWTIVLGNVPTWTTIPNQSDRENTLPQTLDVKPYASSDSGTITAYTLVAPPAGFTMSNGVITVAAGTAVSAHAITVAATNGVGDGQTVFTWTVLEELVAPVWTPIPPQSDLESSLPAQLDISLYATSNSGPLHTWALVTPPPGFTIDQFGVITVAAGTAPAVHAIVVSVSNDQGASSSPSFDWTIGSFFTPPDWSTVSPTSTSEQLLPQDYDVSSYVTSNNGALTGWTINPPVAGFSINGAGVITAAALIEPAIYSLTVEVTNLSGTTASSPFNWEILEYYTVPQWSTIPSQSHGDDELPVAVDISGYVTTTAGPLVNWSLVTPPTGFSISASGVITVAAGTAETTHSITVRVENDEGPADSAPFNWTISDVLLPPQWSTVPAQNDGEDVLPQDLDVSTYVTTNDGALTGWVLVAPPAGFTISGAGVITAAAGITPGTYPITARVTNNSGTEDSTPFSWVIGAVFLAPQWSTVPAQSTEEQLLPVVLDVRPYVTTNHGSLVNWSLVSPPSGWTIDSSGIITVASARPVGSNSITVRVSNDSGTSDSAAFDWDILEEPLTPQWTTVPNKQTRENLLPATYDMKTYVSTNSGPLTGWTLLSPPSGFSIDGSGVITAAGGTAVAIHALTVRVTNDEGTEDSNTFNWEIQEELLVPEWITVPNKSSTWEELPDNYDMTFYVTSNSGALTGWRFSSDPGTGFSINTSGLITATTAAGAGVHSMSVEVFNNQGSSISGQFTWTIAEELLVPQWGTIPDKVSDDTDLPDTYDVSSYVTSNSGPLDTWSLVSPPAGFSISVAGVVTASSPALDTPHSITVRVYNDTGFADKSFNWTVNSSSVASFFHDFTLGSPITLGGYNFSRASAGTCPNHLDVIQHLATNVERIVGARLQSGTTWFSEPGTQGLLLEGQRTNLSASSADWSNYSGEGVNPVGGATTSPDGRVEGSSFSAAAGRNFYVAIAVFNQAGWCAVSYWGKKDSTTLQGYQHYGTSGNPTGDWNYDTEAWQSDNAAAEWVGLVTGRADGWNRVAILDESNNNGVEPSPGGAATAVADFKWGAQVENSTKFASSYIETTGAAATRMVDVVTANLETDLGLPAGGFTTECTFQHTTSFEFRSIDLPNEDLFVLGNATNGLKLNITDTTLTFTKYVGGAATNLSINTGAYSIGQLADIRGVMSPTKMKLWYNIAVTNSNANGTALASPALTATLSPSFGIVKQNRIIFGAESDAVIESWPIWETGGSVPVAPDYSSGTQPSPDTVSEGTDAVFTASAAGSPTPTYQWEAETADGNNTWDDVGNVFGGDVSGGTSTTMTITNTLVADTRRVRQVATNTEGTDTSNVAQLTVEASAGVSPEVQAVFDRMTSLTQQEKDAIEKFVDSQVLSGNWAKMDDFFCFSLNINDALTGFVEFTATDPAPAYPHSVAGFEFNNTEREYIDTNILMATTDHAKIGAYDMGCHIHSFSYVGTSGCYFMGTEADSAFRDVRLNHVGNDGDEFTNKYASSSGYEYPYAQSALDDIIVAHHVVGASATFWIDGVSQGSGVTAGSDELPQTNTLWTGNCNNDGNGQDWTKPHVQSFCYLGGEDMNVLDLHTNARTLIDDLQATPPSISPEVQAVFDRMSSLTPTEEDAIEKFVDSQVASGNWAKMEEFFCFSLNSTDYLQGFLSYTAVLVDSTTQSIKGVNCAAGCVDSTIDLVAATNFSLSDFNVGLYFSEYAYTGTANHQFMGAEGVGNSNDLRVFHRGSDTQDIRQRCMNGSNSPLSSLTQAAMVNSVIAVNGVSSTGHIYHNTTQLTGSAATPTQIPASLLWFGQSSNNGNNQGAYADCTISVGWVGMGLDHDNLYSNLLTLLSELGAV